MFLQNPGIGLRFQNLVKLFIFINRMRKLETNSEQLEPIVAPNDPAFLWHSNIALRKKIKELEQIIKDLKN